MDLESGELDEALMGDEFMMGNLKDALHSGNVDHVMEAVKKIVHARDHREVTIRELVGYCK